MARVLRHTACAECPSPAYGRPLLVATSGLSCSAPAPRSAPSCAPSCSPCPSPCRPQSTVRRAARVRRRGFPAPAPLRLPLQPIADRDEMGGGLLSAVKEEAGSLGRLVSRKTVARARAFMYETNLPWGASYPSLWIATSFAAFLPLIPLSWATYESYCLCAWWALQILFGYKSDYTTAGVPSIYHGLDRLMAPSSVLILTVTSILNLGVIQATAMFVPAVGTWTLAAMARKRNQPALYSLMHGLWHYLGSAVACYALTLNADCQ